MNYLFIPTLLLALAFFRAGALAGRRVLNSVKLCFLVGVGLLASVPAVMFAVCYLGAFNELIWLTSRPTYHLWLAWPRGWD